MLLIQSALTPKTWQRSVNQIYRSSHTDKTICFRLDRLFFPKKGGKKVEIKYVRKIFQNITPLYIFSNPLILIKLFTVFCIERENKIKDSFSSVIFKLHLENCHFSKVANLPYKNEMKTCFNFNEYGFLPKTMFEGNLYKFMLHSYLLCNALILLEKILVTEPKDTSRNGEERVHNVCLPWTHKPKR